MTNIYKRNFGWIVFLKICLIIFGQNTYDKLSEVTELKLKSVALYSVHGVVGFIATVQITIVGLLSVDYSINLIS